MPYLKENYSIDNILSDDDRKNLLRNAVIRFAEEIKINLSPKDKNNYDITIDEIDVDDNGKDIDFDLSVTK